MLFNNDSNLKFYHHLSELEEKLLKSEAERKVLEAKFQYLSETYKIEEERRLNLLKEKYTEFLDGCKERNERNDAILKSLQKVENGASAVFAKTERLKQLRTHYDAYLSRAVPLWRHPDVLQLQAPQLDQEHSSSWIRKSSETSVTRPALLLPGGGAVMLPVDEAGRHIPVGPTYPMPAMSHQVQTHFKVQTPADATTTSFFSLGEAGERMMRELKLIDGHFGVSKTPEFVPQPIFYQPYHLPVYVPPYHANNAFYAPPALNAGTSAQPCFNNKVELDVPDRMKAWSLRRKSNISDTYSPNKSQRSKQGYDIRNQRPPTAGGFIRSDDDLKNKPNIYSCNDVFPGKKFFPVDKDKQFKDNLEIECLAADNTIEEDPNWSDDEVLDVAMGRPHTSYLPKNGYQNDDWKDDQNTIPDTGENEFEVQPTGQNTHPRYETNVLAQRYIQDNPKTPPIQLPAKVRHDVESPVAQRIVSVHQKSIDELKAMLSSEEDEPQVPLISQKVPPVGTPHEPPEQGEQEIEFLVDEDVPEDFNEQNYPDGHYDPRYQRDVSRNVILEEDEEEDEQEKHVLVEPQHSSTRRDDWRKLQMYRQQGKLTANFLPRDDSGLSNYHTHRPEPNGNVSMPSNGYIQEQPPKSPKQYAQQFAALSDPQNYVDDSRYHQFTPEVSDQRYSGVSPSQEDRSSGKTVKMEQQDQRYIPDVHSFEQQQEQMKQPYQDENINQSIIEQNRADYDAEFIGDNKGNENHAYQEGYVRGPEEHQFADQQHNPYFEQRPEDSHHVQRPRGDSLGQYTDYSNAQNLDNRSEHVEKYDGPPGHGEEYAEPGYYPPEDPQQDQNYDSTPHPQNEPLSEFNQVPIENYNRYDRPPESYHPNIQEENRDDRSQHVEGYNGSPGQKEEYNQPQYEPDFYPESTSQEENQNYDSNRQPEFNQPPLENYNRYENERAAENYHPNSMYQEENLDEDRQQPRAEQFGENQEDEVGQPEQYFQHGDPSQPPPGDDQHNQQEFVDMEENDALSPQEQQFDNPEPVLESGDVGITKPGTKNSVLNQLIDSESESYHVEPAGSAHDDSDFDFSMGK